jgi:hypothetical protein
MIGGTPSSLVFILKGFRSLHHICLHDEFLSFGLIILNLEQIVTVDLQSFRVVRVYPSELAPDLVDSLGVINNVEAELVQDI